MGKARLERQVRIVQPSPSGLPQTGRGMDPFCEGPMRSREVSGFLLHGAAMGLMIDKKPDFASATASNLIARMIGEDFASLGEYVGRLMRTFEKPARCRIYVGRDDGELEHRLTVNLEEGGATSDEDWERCLPRGERMARGAFISGRPVVVDRSNGIIIKFRNLEMEDEKGDVFLMPPEGRIGSSSAMMPIYYRESGSPSGIVVFEGDLKCARSGLEGFGRTYWTARAAMAAGAQVSFLLTHRFDALTGLTKRKDFEVDFKRSLRTLLEGRSGPLCLALLDMDDLKKVNDRHGHMVGDQVLRLVGRTVKRCMGPTDRVSRWGGEEFAIVMPETDIDTALRRIEELRSSVESNRILTAEGMIKATCSAGVVDVGAYVSELLDEEGWKRRDLELAVSRFSTKVFVKADQMLDLAKRGGKNRVVAHVMADAAREYSNR